MRLPGSPGVTDAIFLFRIRFLIGVIMVNQLTVAQLLSALNRHRFKAFLVWSLIMLMVTIGFLIWPRKFASEGKLYVQVGRIATGISPAGGSASISVQDTRETEVRSVVEIISSRAVIEAVVDDIGADRILESPLDAWIPDISLPIPDFSRSSNGKLAAEEYKRLKKRELAAKELEDAVKIQAQKKTSVISVFARAISADLAREIVDKMFEHTLKVHLKVHAVDGSTLFFDEQFVEQENKVVRAVKNLADFRNDYKVLSIGAARENLQQIVSKLENQILDTEVEVSQMEKRLDSLRVGMESTDKQLATPTSNVESKAFEDSKHLVFQLEAERERLVSTYSSIHPEVTRIDSQLKKVRQSLKSMSNGRTESALTSNPVYEDLKVDLVRTEADYAGAIARLAKLRKKKTARDAELEDMNEAEVYSDQLQRDVDIARQELGIYSQRRGEAKAMSIMDKRGISDIVVFQEPTMNVKHISPKGSLVLPLGAMMGLLAAIASVLFFERNHLSPALNENEIEQVLELPVLVTLPRVYSSRNMVN